jgi:hypothetical protein
MPGCFNEMVGMVGSGGYCWHCHEWKHYSRVYQIWEGVGRDEQNVYEGGFCPECDEKLDDDYHCRVCGESDGLLEYISFGENTPRLYCPYCLVETAYNDFLKKLEPILEHYPGDNEPMCTNYEEVKNYIEGILLDIINQEV